MSETQVQAQDKHADTVAALQDVMINVDQTVTPTKFTFRFKKDKLGNKRANVDIENAPVPSPQGIVQIMKNGGKEVELLMEVMADTVRSVIGDWIGADENNGAKNFDPAKFTWSAIANMPKEDRRTVTISEEQWTEFSKKYLEIMAGVSGKNAEQLSNAIQLFKGKLALVKTNKAVLGKLKDQLVLFVENLDDQSQDQFADILEMLLRRAETYLAADDVAKLTENL